MRRKKILDSKKAKAIDDFNSQMNAGIGDPINSTENLKTNAYISIDPIMSNDPNELNLEIGTETGMPYDD